MLFSTCFPFLMNHKKFPFPPLNRFIVPMIQRQRSPSLDLDLDFEVIQRLAENYPPSDLVCVCFFHPQGYSFPAVHPSMYRLSELNVDILYEATTDNVPDTR